MENNQLQAEPLDAQELEALAEIFYLKMVIMLLQMLMLMH
jgi:hypothetical protein